jgi:putative membrane protein insertion efficiency factor
MKTILIALIKFYKYFISPVLPGSCRFYPSCSEYALEAVSRYGAVKGTYLALRREKLQRLLRSLLLRRRPLPRKRTSGSKTASFRLFSPQGAER